MRIGVSLAGFVHVRPNFLQDTINKFKRLRPAEHELLQDITYLMTEMSANDRAWSGIVILKFGIACWALELGMWLSWVQ